jgi:hypothetical protein
LFSIAHEFRTLNPEEADFFYVPVYITCFMYPVMGWADFPYYYAPSEPRQVSDLDLDLTVRKQTLIGQPHTDLQSVREI